MLPLKLFAVIRMGRVTHPHYLYVSTEIRYNMIQYDPFNACVTSALELPGKRIVKNLGVARGIIVWSRKIFMTFGASIQTIFGGDITVWTNMCEKARQDAFDRMIANARSLGANAIVAFKYDATDVAQGVTEVLAYGTAVVTEQIGAN